MRNREYANGMCVHWLAVYIFDADSSLIYVCSLSFFFVYMYAVSFVRLKFVLHVARLNF